MAYVLEYSAEVSAFYKARAELKSKPQEKWLHEKWKKYGPSNKCVKEEMEAGERN